MTGTKNELVIVELLIMFLGLDKILYCYFIILQMSLFQAKVQFMVRSLK